MALSDWLRRSRGGEAIRVRKVEAARAMYLTEDIQRVEMKLIMDDGDRLVVDLSSQQTAQLIINLTTAYNAINPPLRPDLRGTQNC